MILKLRNRVPDISPPQESPRRNGGEIAEQVLLSRMVPQGFCQAGTGGGSWNQTLFLVGPRAGQQMAEKAEDSEHAEQGAELQR